MMNLLPGKQTGRVVLERMDLTGQPLPQTRQVEALFGPAEVERVALAHGHQPVTLNEHGDGTCAVAVRRMSVDLAAVLSSLGLPPETLPELITRINLGQEVQVRDEQGTPCVLW